MFQYMMDPHQVTVSLDITLNNPLSQNEEVSHMTSHDPHVTSHAEPVEQVFPGQ